MTPTSLGAAIDLSIIRVLTGFGSRMKVATFKKLFACLVVLTIPVCFLVVTLLVSLPATLVTGEGTGGPLHTKVATGTAVLLALAFAYAAVMDVLRQHFTAARYAVSRSPLRGVWLAADIGLVEAVVAERGVLLVWRAFAQATSLLAAALYLSRSGSSAAADVAWIGLLLPLAYAMSGTALALAHAADHRGPVRRTALAGTVVALVVSLGTGALLAVVTDASTSSEVGGRLPQAVEAVVAVGGWADWVRVGLLVAVLVSIAALTVVLARGSDHDVAETLVSDRGRRTGRTAALLGAVQGWSGYQVGVRVVVVSCCVALVAVGWRVGGGDVPPASVGTHLDRLLVLAAAGGGMVVASNGLLLLGQTRLLWHYRVLWEAGVPAHRLHRDCASPMVVLGTLLAVALASCAIALGRFGSAVTTALVVICALWVEQLVDSYFARADAGEGTRNANSALAVVAYLAAVPAVFIGWSGASWSWPALGGLALLYYAGGLWWFTQRIERLPVIPAA